MSNDHFDIRTKTITKKWKTTSTKHSIGKKQNIQHTKEQLTKHPTNRQTDQNKPKQTKPNKNFWRGFLPVPSSMDMMRSSTLRKEKTEESSDDAKPLVERAVRLTPFFKNNFIVYFFWGGCSVSWAAFNVFFFEAFLFVGVVLSFDGQTFQNKARP